MYKLTRKLLTLHRAFNRNSDIDRLYVHRTLGGRGLLSVFDTIRKECNSLGYHLSKSTEPLLQQVISQGWFSSEEPQLFRAHINDSYLSAFLEKALHGQFYYEVLPQADSKWQWHWLKHAKFTRETEGLIFTAQEQALTTNVMRAKIFHLDHSPLCCLCNSADEMVDHLVSSCSYIAQTDYKRQHVIDQVARYIHWKLAEQFGFEVVDQWWKHSPQQVMVNTSCTLMWDFSITVDSPTPHNRPDITLVDKQHDMVKLIDVAIPGDSRIQQKVVEKKEKYTDIRIKVQRVWKTPVTVVPIFIGSNSKELEANLQDLGVQKWLIPTLQKSVLLNTCYILRHYLTCN